MLDLGRRLATIGKWEAGVPPCVSCHAPEGVGVAPDFPYLAGQHAAYMTQQFEAWRNGQRHNDPLDLMKSVALHLTADELVDTATIPVTASLRPLDAPLVIEDDGPLDADVPDLAAVVADALDIVACVDADQDAQADNDCVTGQVPPFGPTFPSIFLSVAGCVEWPGPRVTAPPARHRLPVS